MTPFKKSRMSHEKVHKVIRDDILVNIYVLFGIYEAKLFVLYGLYRIPIISAETKTPVKTRGCVAVAGREGNMGNYGRIGFDCRLAKESPKLPVISPSISQPRQPMANCDSSPFSFFNILYFIFHFDS